MGEIILLTKIAIAALALSSAGILQAGNAQQAPPSGEQQAPNGFCLSATECAEPGPGQKELSEMELFKLDCEPLSVIRNRILYDHGMCYRKSSYVVQFFNRICLNAKEADEAYDKIPSDTWKAITGIKKIERIKGCVD